MNNKQREIRKRRDDALAEADRVYRWALESATEAMQAARQTYNKAAFEIQKRWEKEISKLADTDA